MQLTERQAEILAFIKSHDTMPTVRAIGAHFGIRSTNGVADHLKALRKKGAIGPLPHAVMPDLVIEVSHPKRRPIVRRVAVFDAKKRHRRLKGEAYKRGIPVTITLAEHIAKLSAGRCAYCGGPLPKTGGALDRIDPSKGYTEANTCACCLDCNIGKAEHTAAEWMRVIGPALALYGAGNVWQHSERARRTRRDRETIRGVQAVVQMVYSMRRWLPPTRQEATPMPPSDADEEAGATHERWNAGLEALREQRERLAG